MRAGCNRYVVEGVIAELDSLRYTPAGIACVSLKIRHESSQMEAGVMRQVICTIPAIAFGGIALETSGLHAGIKVRAEGFLAQRSQRIAQLIMHIDRISQE